MHTNIIRLLLFDISLCSCLLFSPFSSFFLHILLFRLSYPLYLFIVVCFPLIIWPSCLHKPPVHLFHLIPSQFLWLPPHFTFLLSSPLFPSLLSSPLLPFLLSSPLLPSLLPSSLSCLSLPPFPLLPPRRWSTEGEVTKNHSGDCQWRYIFASEVCPMSQLVGESQSRSLTSTVCRRRGRKKLGKIRNISVAMIIRIMSITTIPEYRGNANNKATATLFISSYNIINRHRRNV